MKNSLRVSSTALPSIIAAMMFCVACLAQQVAAPAAAIPAATTGADTNALPRYITSADVSKMPACSAKFTNRLSSYSSAFTTTEGKQFIIGDERGEQWVWHFVCALKVGQT
jgi:hypothetical protein